MAEELFRHKKVRNPLLGAGFQQTISTFAERLGRNGVLHAEVRQMRWCLRVRKSED